MCMKKVHVHWTFPEDILRELSSWVKAGERSRFVAEATHEALKKLNLLNSLERASGAWKAKEHPGLKTKKNIEQYASKLRKGWSQRLKRASR